MTWRKGPKFGVEALPHAKFHPHRCNVSPLRGEKLQNRPLSKLNIRRFALRAMLPVNSTAGARSGRARSVNADEFVVALANVAITQCRQ